VAIWQEIVVLRKIGIVWLTEFDNIRKVCGPAERPLRA